MRHGEVDLNNSKYLSQSEFYLWLKEYNSSSIKYPFHTKEKIETILKDPNIVICSNLSRSIESVTIFQKNPFENNSLFNEAEIPHLAWDFIKLKPLIWLILSRLAWLLGYSKNCESISSMRKRAKIASQRLIELSEDNKTIVLVGHGIFNRFIKKELILKKWTETQKLQHTNWGYGLYEFTT